MVGNVTMIFALRLNKASISLRIYAGGGFYCKKHYTQGVEICLTK